MSVRGERIERNERISHHLERAENLLWQCERATDEEAIRLWTGQARAHSLQAQALQEQRRWLDPK